MKPNFITTKDNMELILRQDVQNLGFKDDIVCENGYGRNF
jgi:large subunit ribosomal protein L9